MCLQCSDRLCLYTAAGQLLPEQQRGWRPSLISNLRIEHSAATLEGVTHLLAMPRLEFLDIRGTAALQHGVLQKLARHFRLQVRLLHLLGSRKRGSYPLSLDFVDIRGAAARSPSNQTAGDQTRLRSFVNFIIL